MPLKTGFVLLIVFVSVVTTASVAYGGRDDYSTTVLTLERAFPANKTVELEILKTRDRVRHARILQGFAGGVVDFTVSGSLDPYYGGLYFTKVKLGSPPREFNVQIDTGSDILWVTCSSCIDCPELSGLGIPLNFFDSATSSTASLVSCSDSICSSNFKTGDTSCSDQNDQCGYQFNYADYSGTSGHYVTDNLYLDTVIDPSTIANSSASITFGCSTDQSGSLTKSNAAIDGIFGFGQHDLSVISQLSAQGITPKVFSHCLRGDGAGGGKLVLGEILAPNMVYSPLVPSQPHYNLDLQSIVVGEQQLAIDPTVFETSKNQGTIVDTGTTLTYLVSQAFDPFVDAITAVVSELSTTSFNSQENKCYLMTSSTTEVFPKVTLNFAGGASMILKPENYLMPGDPVLNGFSHCIGFQRASNGLTVLGDLVLKDKIFVYDLSRSRIGWADYDCSADVNVSIKSNTNEYVNTKEWNAGILLGFTSLKTLSVHILVGSFWFLLW